ncbi:MAG: GGDEF domain-containing protein [Candidatus Abyssobacteria bacterium SURF_17]|uniref:diguanylate cyclase n=1 Tax=Candidatus Abyssobacteria bacterium SURF_17 TaxID=2093361 RepID=A0A419ENG7_9BACT|nr:MAG: GGDEF domain-containing protein [Candidatus Abyssubacteria bacterium SURF_17]
MPERKTITDFGNPGPPHNEKRPSLIVLAGRDFGRQYFLARGETTIGRDEDCTIRLNDGRASRKHAKVVGDPGGKSGPHFRVIDLDSTNGTFLNDQQIKEAELSEGDRIRIGYTVFKYAIRDIAEIEYGDKIYRMATTDALTRLLSRDYFFQQYSDLFRRSERYSRPFSLMMVDIDDFKSVNDSYGHPVGDKVLEGIGQMITAVIRYEDLAARYGGEEFVIILPETAPESARNPAERLRRSLEAHQFRAGDATFSVTISVGIASYPDHASTMEELLQKADIALYQAKRSGKNAVRVFQHDTEK